MENNTIPDSISTNMRDRSFLPLVAPTFPLSKGALTSRNTLKILKIIKPVTRAFTIKDIAMLVRIIGNSQSGYTVWPSKISNELQPTSQIAGGKQLKQTSSERRQVD
jgi:hypothetical protein